MSKSSLIGDNLIITDDPINSGEVQETEISKSFNFPILTIEQYREMQNFFNPLGTQEGRNEFEKVIDNALLKAKKDEDLEFVFSRSKIIVPKEIINDILEKKECKK